MKFYEVQKHLTVSNHAYLGYAFIVNKAAWDGLPPDLQEVLQTSIEEARDYQRSLNAKLDDELKAGMADYGLEIIELDAASIAAFVEASKPVHEGYVEVIGEDMLKATYDTTAAFVN